MLQRASEFSSFVRLNDVPLYVDTSCLPVHPLMDT